MVEGQVNREQKESEPRRPLGFVMIKGDLSKEVFGNDPSITPNDPRSETKVHAWISEFFAEYAQLACGTKVRVLKTKICPGMSHSDLVELYGQGHGQWMDSLTTEDYQQQIAIFDGTIAPLVMAIVEVTDAENSQQAEEKLIEIRNIFRSDWHEYLGKSEVKLPGRSTIFLSALHVGSYENDRNLISRFGLSLD